MRCGLCAFACVALAFAAAGCGDSDPRALDPVASAADRTLDQQTGRFVTRFGGPYVWIVPGGSGSFNVPDEAMAVMMSCCPGFSDAPTVLEFRMIYPMGYAGYVQDLDVLGRPHGTVRRWVKIDLRRKLTKQLSSLPGVFQIGIVHSPVNGLALLRGSKHAKELRDETIDGVRTTHYRVTVDMEEAFAKATPQERTALSVMRVQDEGAWPAGIDVWVSNDGLVRRMRQALGDVQTMTTTFSHFGERVHLDAPRGPETVYVQ